MNAFAPDAEFQADARPYKFTLDDVFAMVEAGIIDPDARIELIDGELIQMAAQSAPHAIAKSELAKIIFRQLGNEAKLIVDATMKLAPKDAPEPDLYIYPPSVKLKAAKGSDLLLLIEVADSTLRRDLKVKAKLYASYGIPEYWVFEVGTRRTHVHRLGSDGYGKPTLARPDEVLKPLLVPSLSLRMADLPPFE